MFENLPNPPYIFAHRGASAYAPENTLSAFALALEQGAPAVEFDVKLTSDRQVIAIHDPTVDRTTNGTGKVSELSLAALRELDAGSWKDARYKSERIPTLEEIFESFGRKLFMNIELTNYTTPADGLVEAVCGLVTRHGLQDHVLFSSFEYENLVTVRQLLPEIPCGQLFSPMLKGWWLRWIKSGSLDIEAEHPFTLDACSASVRRAHKRGRRVHVWTINKPIDMRRLRNLGVDGIFTDDPPLAQEHFLMR